ncbi:MAG: glycosyltransferase family 4 protein [Cyclobacteriaceae bacterium]
MKILYVHQYFRTPEEGGCVRSYHLAKGLVEHGHEVEMITAHSGDYQIAHVEGIKVHYLPVPYKNGYGFIRRIFSYLKFVRLAKKESIKIKGVDLAYVMTTPLTTGLIALFVKNKLNIPYYFEVGDLWPEAPIQMGVIKNRFLRSFLYGFEKRCYFEAQKVVALSPAIRNYIERLSPQTKVHVLPNISHCDFFDHKVSMKTFNSQNPFQVGYIGTVGKANNLEYLIAVAKYSLRQDLPIVFHIMGEGAQLSKLRRATNGMQNVIFHNFGSQNDVKEVIEQMDAVYISFLNIPVLNTGSPNKFFDGLAAGKLIIVNFKGWIKDVVEKNGCGFYAPPHKPEKLCAQIESYIQNSSKLMQAQRNARKMAETFYDKKLLVSKLIKIINNETSIPLDDSEIHILTA